MASTNHRASARPVAKSRRLSDPSIGGRGLVPGEWAVLGLLAEAPVHGFVLAKALAPEGEIGMIWTVPRQLVYRTLGVLEDNGLVRAVATEAGPGPVRTIMSVTPAGQRAVERWMVEPVPHIRDARSLLMLKLVFLERSRYDVRPLLERQRELLLPALAAQRERVEEASGSRRTVELWRLECVDAVIGFAERMLGASQIEHGDQVAPGESHPPPRPLARSRRPG
ncbi:MAG TPA: PadR family transcriptional regulator [Solirubrobacteraceae bacterium]|nr:PadR family transcriptional regulator [Solirubrobacteraceae bacterium]